MDQIKTGALIRQLRTVHGLTQRQLAEQLHVSDKAVSKWETGGGCPDISLLRRLAELLDTEVHVLLSGEIHPNEKEKGNMNKLKFYVCAGCGNILTATSEAEITCCGRRLTALQPREAEPQERLCVEEADGDWFITSGHPMTKAHHISFVAYQNDSTLMLFKQYPEWDLQVTMPRFRAGRLLWYCAGCGLCTQRMEPQTAQ